ncbi:hypothetical protein BVY04_03170 [bacterium M21]|nr:hypothetical protein BVY04_03170 [bacterium M21]
MDLIKKLELPCFEAQIKISNKEEALRIVARQAVQHPSLSAINPDEIFEALQTREEIGTTGFGDGIALPHCRMEGATEFVVGAISVTDGVEFDSLDGRPAKLLVFIIAPANEARAHVRLLSSISHTLLIPGAVDEMLACTTAKNLLDSFTRHLQDEVETTDHQSRNMVHLVIQNESMFHDLLSVFMGLPSCSFIVVETSNAGAYLANMPLFAAFWKEEEVQFSRMIVGSIDRTMCNEMIRRIERVAGSLKECRDILLTVQEVFFTAGGLIE